ncbi:hypothetical protein GGX14DRAFT_408546 [Mycena pura]|uniref:Uncharacterized protein n=1 Tax=Mycena pura TaxID=153505 RepID=A0AAD6UP20_9AGAR|nr:hypothetical protein GGX14DRAFT_408546 [Mycena pura]
MSTSVSLKAKPPTAKAARNSTAPRKGKDIVQKVKDTTREAKDLSKNEAIAGDNVKKGMQLDLKKLTIGHVKWPLFADELGDGLWPAIQKGRLERPQHAGAANQQRALSGDGSGYQTMLPEHAIILAIDREHINPECLTTDVLADLKYPVFVGDIAVIKPERVAGQHRMLVFKEHYKAAITSVRKLGKKQQLSEIEGRDFKVSKNALLHKAVWRVILVDKTLLVSADFAAEFLHLRSNNTITSFNDTPQYSFASLLTAYRTLPAAQHDDLRKLALGLKKLGPLASRHYDAVKFMAPIHGIDPSFDKHMVGPEKIVAMKDTVWQAFSILVEAAHAAFKALITVSDSSTDDGQVMVEELGRELVCVFEDAFLDHLRDRFDHFGYRGSVIFAEARDHYSKAIVAGVKIVIVERKSDINITDAELRIHSDLVQRVESLLADTDTTYPKAPLWLPLLCPSFLLMLSELLLSLDFAFALMAHILMPGHSEAATHRSSVNNAVIPSATCRVMANFSHFANFGNNGWDTQPHSTTDADACVLLSTLIEHILTLRATVLFPAKAVIEKALQTDGAALVDKSQWTDVTNEMKAVVKCWQSQGLKAMKLILGASVILKLSEYKIRYLQHLPAEHIPQNAGQLARDITRILGFHYADHLTLGGSAAPANRKRFALHAAQEHYALTKPDTGILAAFASSEPMRFFRQTVVSAVKANPLFSKYSFWYDVPGSTGDDLRWEKDYSEHVDTHVGEKDRVRDAQLRSDKVNLHFHKLVRALQKDDDFSWELQVEVHGKKNMQKIRALDPALIRPLEVLLEALRKTKTSREDIEEEGYVEHFFENLPKAYEVAVLHQSDPDNLSEVSSKKDSDEWEEEEEENEDQAVPSSFPATSDKDGNWPSSPPPANQGPRKKRANSSENPDESQAKKAKMGA